MFEGAILQARRVSWQRLSRRAARLAERGEELRGGSPMRSSTNSISVQVKSHRARSIANHYARLVDAVPGLERLELLGPGRAVLDEMRSE